VQILLSICIYILFAVQSQGEEAYYQKVVALNGIGGVLAAIPLYLLYRKDRRRRVACGVIPKQKTRGNSILDGVFLLFIGAALSLFSNFILSFFSQILQTEEYTESMNQVMDGKTIWFLIFWIGIVGPIYEEILFRWVIYLRIRDHRSFLVSAVLSGAMFGIYHGNLTQFVYATVLGIFFACFLEWTGSLWSSVLLHIGANTWSLLLSEYGEKVLYEMNATEVLLILGCFVLILIVGVNYFHNKGRNQIRQI
jgi:membrane protease YdiL (CAAX protease family)